MAILIQASHVAFAHGGNQIFTDVTFELKDGDRIAVVGANGTGKSTLFRLLAREITPGQGDVVAQRGVRVGYLSQQIVLEPGLTPWEIVGAASSDRETLERDLAVLEARLSEPLGDDEMADVLDAYNHLLNRIDEGSDKDAGEVIAGLLTGLRLPERLWRQPVEQLSGGEKKLVAIATFLCEEPDVLLLDEPENHLDMDARAWLESYLQHYRGVVGLISHDRYMIDRVANTIVELEDGRLTAYPGNYSEFRRLKRERLERQAQLRELQEREFRKLKASAEQLTQWARQNPKFASRAENQRRKMAEERQRLDETPAPILNRRTIDVEFTAERGSTMVLHAQALAKAYDTHTVFEPFDLTIRHGERIGLWGRNGAGKTTLFRLIQGMEPPTGGTLRTGPSIQVGYFSQEHETLDRSRSAIDLVRQQKALNEQQALGYLTGYLFDRDDAMRPVGELSGGERSRLQIALVILSGANFLLLDEPTNNLDLDSVEALEAALLEFGGTILAISHDRYFLDRVCTRTLALDAGIVLDYEGSWTAVQEHPELGTPLTRALREPAPAKAKPAARRR
ncbi:MAG TPA: ABC-F family ATP-binding cassette domain-containing protein [Thermomicrobiales bacterium]|nr:ABC-F family ATP-binding cassette domain-containing protein [Thermomicrobiales bacterium]